VADRDTRRIRVAGPPEALIRAVDSSWLLLGGGFPAIYPMIASP
jgi:hypothetical protein